MVEPPVVLGAAVWHVVQVRQRSRHQAVAFSRVLDWCAGAVLHHPVLGRLQCAASARHQLDLSGERFLCEFLSAVLLCFLNLLIIVLTPTNLPCLTDFHWLGCRCQRHCADHEQLDCCQRHPGFDIVCFCYCGRRRATSGQFLLVLDGAAAAECALRRLARRHSVHRVDGALCTHRYRALHGVRVEVDLRIIHLACTLLLSFTCSSLTTRGSIIQFAQVELITRAWR